MAITKQVQTALPPPPGYQEEKEKDTSRGIEEYPDATEQIPDFNWKTKFQTDIVSFIERLADNLGVPKFTLDAFVRDNMDGAMGYITKNVFLPNKQSHVEYDEELDAMRPVQTDWNPTSPEDWQQIWNAGLLYFSAKLGVDLTSGGAPKSGGRGGGSRGPSAQDIRNQFDENQLTDAAQSIWGRYMLEDTPDARKIAKDYINTVVATRGEVDMDFETFVKGKFRKTSRYQTIYRNKPEGIDELAYVTPYFQGAASVMGGAGGDQQAIGDVAMGGAALGASSDAFRNRLEMTDENINSTGFITGLEDTVRGVKDLLRG